MAGPLLLPHLPSLLSDSGQLAGRCISEADLGVLRLTHGFRSFRCIYTS